MTAFFFIIGTLLSYLLPIVMHINEIRLCRFLFGSLTMLYLTPTFINVFVIYAIANLHDISWGNRPSQNAGLSKQKTGPEGQVRDLPLKGAHSVGAVQLSLCLRNNLHLTENA